MDEPARVRWMIAEMLFRYPHLDAQERLYLAKLIRTISRFEIALLRLDPQLGKAYRNFRADLAPMLEPASRRPQG